MKLTKEEKGLIYIAMIKMAADAEKNIDNDYMHLLSSRETLIKQHGEWIALKDKFELDLNAK